MDFLGAGRKRSAAELGSMEEEPGMKDFMYITPLGAGNEVGRSCIFMEYRDKRIMLDCGIHPAYNNMRGLPYFDHIDPSTIDLLLISHFHLDHCAALPYFLERTSFKGRVFMTHPTKAIYKMILSDYIKVSNINVEDMLYDEKHLLASMEKIETINYHQEMSHNGIKFWCYNAGHVLGAAMFMIEINGVRVLYTGDFSRQEDRHLMAAETPSIRPDVLICESTYGVQIHEPKPDREARFCRLVHDIIERGGRCLIPVFALGRAQELLLILDEYWDGHPELQDIPIYYGSALAQRCMSVYQTYINMMNERIRSQFAISNPFLFKHISNLTSIEHFDDSGPSVVMASPGMLQNGMSRELFEKWCTRKQNGVVIPGYCVEGTLAKHVMSEPETITTMSGMEVTLKMSVRYISFSAHSDFKQTREFVDLLEPPYIVLVHGDANEMNRLKNALTLRYEGKDVEILTPKNCTSVSLEFKATKIAKTVGDLAAEEPTEKGEIEGYVVQKDFGNPILLAPADLDIYTNLNSTVITQRQVVPFNLPLSTLQTVLESMYEYVEADEEEEEDGNIKAHIIVHQEIKISQLKGKVDNITLEWDSSIMNDMLADSILTLVAQLQSTPLENSNHRCSHSKHHVKGEKETEKEEEEELKELEQGEEEIQFLSEEEKKEQERRNLILKILRPQFKEIKWDDKYKQILIAKGPSSKIARYSTTETTLEEEEEGELEFGERGIDSKKIKDGDDELANALQRAYLRARMAVYPMA